MPLLLHFPCKHETTGGDGLQTNGGEGGVGEQRAREGAVQRVLRVHPPRPGRRPGALLRRSTPWGCLSHHGRLEGLGGAPAAVLRWLEEGCSGAKPSLLWLVREGAGARGAPVPAGVLRVSVPGSRAAIQHAGEGENVLHVVYL